MVCSEPVLSLSKESCRTSPRMGYKLLPSTKANQSVVSIRAGIAVACLARSATCDRTLHLFQKPVLPQPLQIGSDKRRHVLRRRHVFGGQIDLARGDHSLELLGNLAWRAC